MIEKRGNLSDTDSARQSILLHYCVFKLTEVLQGYYRRCFLFRGDSVVRMLVTTLQVAQESIIGQISIYYTKIG